MMSMQAQVRAGQGPPQSRASRTGFAAGELNQKFITCNESPPDALYVHLVSEDALVHLSGPMGQSLPCHPS
jgi:hypothetical protein